MHLPHRSLSLAITVLLLLALAPSGVQGAVPQRADLPRAASDITRTVEGRKYALEAASRFAAYGYQPSSLRVVRDDLGVLVVSAETKLESYVVGLAKGGQGTALAPLTPDRPADGTSGEAARVTPLASPAWTFQDNSCFSRISDTWSVIDHCYTMYRLSNDGNAAYDWFALNHYATAASNFPWTLTWARIRAYRYGSSPQTWADWSPKEDWSGGSCSTITIGVATPVGGIGQSFERCPQQVTFSKSANGSQPDYTQTWFGPGTRGNRALNFEIAVRVVQGGWAQWALPAETHGSF